MKGDFSKWQFDEDQNYNGVLQQQGRVFLDEDWNAQTRITSRWQDTAAQDAFGPGVAAVPADNADAFKVIEISSVSDEGINITLGIGRLWADGVLVHLAGNEETSEDTSTNTTITATYFETPDEEGLEDRGEGDRDAVVLEVWREEVNAFQLPDDLIEPALGGPDTTERMHTVMALRLLRLRPGDVCENIRDRLQNQFKTTGRLTVSLDSTDTSDSDCPVTEVGGYTGFEHRLYRIELALVNSDRPMFKWSQFNGGLVGRGDYHPGGEGDEEEWFTITANDQAIKNSGLCNFYLEVVEDNLDNYGHRRVIYGARVVLDGDRLSVGDVFLGEVPSNDGDNGVFFRLWNDIVEIPESSDEYPLHDGILLQFHSSHEAYRNPGDYWTFQVRADLDNEPTLLNEQLPYGVKYHRVPLAELHWTNATNATIEDCRRIFRPLTNQKVCCSYTVGRDGDYEKIQDAINAIDKLHAWGGEICLLPGIHFANVSINDKFNIKIKGCGFRTILIPKIKNLAKEIFNINKSSHIIIENVALFCSKGLIVNQSHAIEISHCYFWVFQQAIHVTEGSALNIHHNKIWMFDNQAGQELIYSSSDNCLIERNEVAVIPHNIMKEEIGDLGIPDATVDCPPEPQEILNYAEPLLTIMAKANPINWTAPNPFRALGGIQIGSGSDHVKIIDNRIWGGRGNGITLGNNLDIEEPLSTDAPSPFTFTFYGTKQDVIFDVLLYGERIQIRVALYEYKSDGNIDIDNISYDTTEINEWTNAFKKSSPTTKYGIKISNEEYRIDGVDDVVDDVVDDEFIVPITIFSINVTPVAQEEHLNSVVSASRGEYEFTSLLAFIYDVTIRDNKISNMGLSGIGTPQLNLLALNIKNFKKNYPLISMLAEQYGVISGFVVDLIIENNPISKCLQNRFGDDEFGIIMKGLVARRGEGGISLGLCENVSIRNNRIEENGHGHKDPVCGIFVTYAAQADIRDNKIINNAPLILSTPKPNDLTAGIRGGVVLRLTMPLMIASALEEESVLAAIGGFAARIHDNVILQPVGQALTVLALGATSVMNNRFQVDFSNYSNLHTKLGWIDKLAATVLIINFGGRAFKIFRRKGPQRIVMWGSNETYRESSNLGPGSIFGGVTNYTNNQTRLGFNIGSSISSQAIRTFDDLIFANNQSDVMPLSNNDILLNTLLIANSLRSGLNRFCEPDLSVNTENASLLTLSNVINNTTNNQGDHCILAGTLGDPTKLIYAGNVDLSISDKCEKLIDTLPEYWNITIKNSYIEEFNAKLEEIRNELVGLINET